MKNKTNSSDSFNVWIAIAVIIFLIILYSIFKKGNNDSITPVSDCINYSEKLNKESLDSENQLRLSKGKWVAKLDSILKLSNKKSFKTNETSYSGLNFKFSNTFTFDRYDDTYHYATAERGEKYLTTNVNITSSSKDPNLNGFAVYYLDKDSALRYITSFSFKFQRWEDYGTYLGNYHDKSNDFAYSETVKFAMGAKIPTEYLNKPIIIVSRKEPTFVKSIERFGNPPVSYDSGGTMLQNISRSFEWDDNKYVFIALLNR